MIPAKPTQTMIDIGSIWEAYLRDRRSRSLTGYRREDLGYLVRYKPLRADLDGLICFANLPASEVDHEIIAQCRLFAEREMAFEWKIYDKDQPAALPTRLGFHGFHQGASESLMINEVGKVDAERRDSRSCIVRRLSSRRELAAIVSLQEAVWKQPFPWLLEQLCSLNKGVACYCAFNGKEPIGTGWIEFPDDSPFAELHGGAVLPEWRGTGI
jgi:hypothetical protein